MKTVAVLSTGNELLNGTTSDTNGGYICGLLFPLSVRVRQRIVAGDDPGTLAAVLRYALDASDIVIMTGGLGPTDDDNTLAAINELLRLPPHVDMGSLNRMETYFRTMGLQVNDSDRKMVEVPEGARVIRNENGLAPGFIISVDGRIIIALPGVPREMELMMDRYVMPYLKKECGIIERGAASFRVTCMRESEINDMVRGMPIPLGQLEWGMTAKSGIITVTFAQLGGDPVDYDAIINIAREAFGGRFLDPSFETPEKEVVALLRERRLTLSIAESCTGGLVSKRITDVPGASEVFTGSIIAYSNSVKVARLGVSEATLAKFGAVSQETALEMASGIRRELGTDMGISITGIAGPGGGSEAKPVGTVWFGFADAGGARAFRLQIGGDRDHVRAFAALTAIELLRGHLKKEGGREQQSGAVRPGPA